MGRTATGIDIGRSTVKLLRGEVKGTSFVVTHFALAESRSDDVAGGWAALAAAAPGIKVASARVGLTGRDVNVRYTRVPRVPDWKLRNLMRFEAKEISDQSESAVASDFNVLPEMPEIEGEDVVLLAMAREGFLEEHVAGLASVGGTLDAFTPNALALYNAYLHYGVVQDETVLVANIGRVHTDVILVRGPDLLFARNLSGGSGLFDEALAQRFDISPERAERYKIESGTLESHQRFADATQEKAKRALAGPAGQILSLLQSAVVFCKSQVKLTSLKLDRVLLTGGGSRLTGLSEYLAAALSVPVEHFDPFVVVDTSKLDPASAALLEQHRAEAVVALGLATAASDPDAYSIEILPERVQKRRDFNGGTAFLIASAVLGCLYLGLSAWRSHGRLGDARAEAALLDSRVRRSQRDHQETQDLLGENMELARHTRELHSLSGSGEQLVRALDAIERHLPQDFWLEGMTSGLGSDEELGIARQSERPILRLRGRAREGTDGPTVLFEEFVADLRRSLPEARLKERMGGTASSFTIDMTLFADAPSADSEAEEGEG